MIMSFNQFDNDFRPKKSGVMMRVRPEFRAFARGWGEEKGISDTAATGEIVKAMEVGIITSIPDWRKYLPIRRKL
jgi:hypothetical protein